MECEMCTENDKACTKERTSTGAVAPRAALESAVQLGRGDEGNRQAEMANPTKCRDSLQWATAPPTLLYVISMLNISISILSMSKSGHAIV
jgi:hypothetical protein